MSTVINLPAPNKTGSMPLEQAIVNRRSQRDFLSKPLTIEQIGQIAWSAQGKEPKSGFRTVPSAGATYPLELFLLTDEGLFHYLPAKHSLEKLAGNDLRADLATAGLGQGFIKTAPLTVVFAADFSRTTSHYGRRGVRYVYMEAGHAAQNVHLQAEALGLGSVAVGAFDDDAVSKVLALPNYLEPIYLLVAGYHRK